MRPDIESWAYGTTLDFVVFVNPTAPLTDIEKYCNDKDILGFIIINVNKLYYFDSIRTYYSVDYVDHFDSREFDITELFKIFNIIPDNKRLRIQSLLFISEIKEIFLPALDHPNEEINQLIFDLNAIMTYSQIRFNWLELKEAANMLS